MSDEEQEGGFLAWVTVAGVQVEGDYISPSLSFKGVGDDYLPKQRVREVIEEKDDWRGKELIEKLGLDNYSRTSDEKKGDDGEMSNNRVHDSRLETIARTPRIIGVDDILLSTGESYLLDGVGGVYGSPDNLLFNPLRKILYQVEYKCGENHRDLALSQLGRNREFLQRIFKGWEVRGVYVHGNYESEEVKYP